MRYWGTVDREDSQDHHEPVIESSRSSLEAVLTLRSAAEAS